MGLLPQVADRDTVLQKLTAETTKLRNKFQERNSEVKVVICCREDGLNQGCIEVKSSCSAVAQENRGPPKASGLLHRNANGVRGASQWFGGEGSWCFFIISSSFIIFYNALTLTIVTVQFSLFLSLLTKNIFKILDRHFVGPLTWQFHSVVLL